MQRRQSCTRRLERNLCLRKSYIPFLVFSTLSSVIAVAVDTAINLPCPKMLMQFKEWWSKSCVEYSPGYYIGESQGA